MGEHGPYIEAAARQAVYDAKEARTMARLAVVMSLIAVSVAMIVLIWR